MKWRWPGRVFGWVDRLTRLVWLLLLLMQARQAGWIDVTTRNMRAEYAVGWKKFLIWSLIITLSFCWTSVNSCNVCAKCCCCWCGFQGAAILVNAIISDQIRFYQNSNIDFHFFASPKTMLSEQQRNLCDDINRILVSFVWLFQRGSKYTLLSTHDISTSDGK